MAKSDVIAAGITAIQAGEVQVYTDQLGIAYDAGAVDQKASDGTLTQSDLNAAVKAATDPLNQQITDLTAKDASDVQAGQAALASLQAQFDAMSADKKVEDGVIAGLQSAKDQLAAILASLSSIGQPVPTPAPTPTTTP